MGLSVVIRQSWYAGLKMCDVVSEKARACRVCVRLFLEVDRVLRWKKLSNRCAGFLPDHFQNAPCEMHSIKPADSRVGEFMKQLLFLTVNGKN